MKLHLLLTSLLCACAIGVWAETDTLVPPTSSTVTLHVIPVSGPVEPAMAAFIGRAVREALTDEDDIAVLEMDTWGGRVDAAMLIVDTLLQFPKERVVAYVRTKAISAGALIALSCGSLYMREGTTIGDCAPITQTNEGMQRLDEKVQSPLRAKFRTIARRNGYPLALSESMVTEEMVVYRLTGDDTTAYVDSLDYENLTQDEKDLFSRKTIAVARGELLTMDDHEAREMGFSSASVQGVEDLPEKMGQTGAAVVQLEQNWSENFARFLTTIAPILILVGIAGLYIEAKSPGLGLPGAVGVIALALAFGGQYMVGLADYTELIVIAVGVVLLAVEVFVIPGFGVVGIAGIFCILVGMLLSMQDFVLPNPDLPWQKDLLILNLKRTIFSLTGGVVVVVLFFRYVFPHVNAIVPGPVLSASLAGVHVSPASGPTVSVGDAGTVLKTLRPSGSVRFGDEVFDVVTDGEFYEKGEAVSVSEIRGNTIVVTRSAQS